MKKNLLSLIVLLAANLFWSCDNNGDKKFRLVPSSESGITFRNTLKESTDFNIFNYMYFYNGGGVATGDLNGDDLPDIYFTANQEPNKLYLNLGNLKFKDITELSGVAGFNGWTTGVTMADVNSDGKLDIYVSYVGDYLIYKGKNQLFINEGNDGNGIPQFSDRAMEFGLDLVGFSTQAAFFDYDLDGDLDMFMLNHSLHQNGTFGKAGLRKTNHPLAGDKLMRNDDGRFVDATDGSGIYKSVLGYGLGVVVSDMNMDGWPDIYVGNDFHENDYLYANQHDGTFKEMLEQSMNHTSRYTMGVDFADINNDAYPDLVSMDMLPEDQTILKASQAEDAYDVYNYKINYGFNHQYARNNLQLNNQDGSFSEIALLSGVAATDWSWSALFADFDLDGYKDLFISNGIVRRSNDLDYINFITVDSVQMKLKDEIGERELGYFEKMPKIKLANYLYINNHDSTFTNRALDWGLDKISYSNGAAYADLDNDGDLDIVTNNIEDEAFVFENRTFRKQTQVDTTSNHFLRITLKGADGNYFGIGAKALVYSDGNVHLQECVPTRGYLSAVDPRLLFGLGRNTKADSVIVIWNDKKFEKKLNVKANQTVVFDQHHASGEFIYNFNHPGKTPFRKATQDLSLPYKHRENDFIEFDREPLIPHMVSAEGPASAIGDVNGDGLEDIYLGGGKRQSGVTFIQTKEGKFIEMAQPVFKEDSVYEDVDAIFFDADNDHDLDLLVMSGGNEFSGRSMYCTPRLYSNDGKGNFKRSLTIPLIFTTGSCVAVHDINNDGSEDLFVGSRAKPWHYGIKPDSYVLINDGKGNFTDRTKEIAPSLLKFGFVKDACWADMDGDGKDDLIITGEWSPMTILLNKKNKLVELDSKTSGLYGTNGWWNTTVPFDMDRDGDLDLVAGNLGENSKLKASAKEPVKLFAGDLDNNDSTDQVLTHFVKGKEYPFYTRDELTKRMPFLKKRYLSYHTFAQANLYDVFPEQQLEKAEQHLAYTFETCMFENLGNGKFNMRPLPKAAQLSTVNAIEVADVNNDGSADLILAGNFYPINIQMGRNDASYGLVLLGDGKGNFKPIPAIQSGFSVNGEVRCLKQIMVGETVYFLAIRNNDTVEAFTLNKN
jgi:enediyne biosynthesis protein E4